MIKLTCARPRDEFDRVTVLGTEAGIFDLWFRLTHANPEFPSHGVETIRITSLDDHAIDPTKGIREAYRVGTELDRQ